MAYFLDSDERLIQATLNERRLVILAAPRRSGLTFWCHRAFGGFSAQKGWTKFIDLARYSDQQKLKSEFARCMSAPLDFQKTEELLKGWDSNEVIIEKPTLVVFLNSHRASKDALKWMVRTLLEIADDVRSESTGFVIEGSADPDIALADAYPDGPPTMPLIRYAEPPAPWRSLVESEEIRRVRFDKHSDLLSPWLTDFSGGDVRLTIELFEKLPVGIHLSQEQIDDACTAAITRGATATELGRCALALTSKAILNQLCNGHILHTSPPPYFPSQELKTLYLEGFATYDPVVAGFRLRAASVFEALKHKNILDGLTQASAKELISARTTVILAYVAAVELQLRSLLGTTDLEKLAADVSTNTEFGKIGPELKRKLAQIGGLKSQMAEVSRVCGEVVPERQTVLSAALGRKSGANLYPGELVEYVTLNELSLLAKKAELIEEQDENTVRLINKTRNDLAHFRGARFGDARDVVAAAHRLLERLAAAVKRPRSVSENPTLEGGPKE